jgi:CRP/FNR family transcriptional regulator, cyclic AMP receptor protein
MSNNEAQAELDYLLYRIPLFTAFSKAVASELASRITERKVEAGESIFREGDVGKELLIVRRGVVRIFLPGGDGRDEAVLALLHDGEFFGELSLLDGETRSASAVAVVETILLCLQHDDFYTALQSDCAAVKHVIAVLCHRLRATDVRLACAAFRDVRERLAHRLWQMAERESCRTEDGLRLTAPVSDADLAQQVGATTSRVQAELIRLQRDLVIRRYGTELTVLKPHDLRDMALGASSSAAITVPEWLLG